MSSPSTPASLKIGTRGSPLALAQATDVRRRLERVHPELAAPGAVDIVVIRTSGDRLQQGPLSEMGGKGLFTKEIEEALQDGRIDIAVHSMKDVPTVLPDGLTIDCFLPREDPRDALIAPLADRLNELPDGATVGTSSLRRRAMVLLRRPDVKIVNLRGNVDTRLQRVTGGEMDATFLAVAGLNRLGRTDVGATPIDPAEMLPAVCQGIIGVERRVADDRVAGLLRPLNDLAAETSAVAERALLAGLDGSCRTPIAALATLTDDSLTLRSAIVRPDGSECLEATRQGPRSDAVALGADAAGELRGRAGPGFFDG